VRGATTRSRGISASKPPARHARIQRSSVDRPINTRRPSGPTCSTSASARTSAPRSAFDSAASPAPRITLYLNSPTSRRRSSPTPTARSSRSTTRPRTLTSAASNRGQLVWHSRLPPHSTLTTDHAGRDPNRNTNARAATATASNASPATLPAGSTRPSPGSSACAHRVKCDRIASAPATNARRHPRTVDTANPASAATRRCPRPAATIATNAAPITATSSWRRTRPRSLSRTCVPAHARHFARRGRSTTSPDRQRSTRSRANPHRASTPPQPGHANSPATNSRSTTTSSASTISNGVPPGIKEPSRRDTPMLDGRALRVHKPPSLTPLHHHAPLSRRRHPASTTATPASSTDLSFNRSSGVQAARVPSGALASS
jgi:hypothetical protein